MTETNPNQKCIYFPHLGPVECLPAPNISPLAKETFAEGKMFWNEVKYVLRYFDELLFFSQSSIFHKI